MQKRILKKIAAEWGAGILLHGTGTDSFDEEEDGLSTCRERTLINIVKDYGKL